MTVMRMPAVSMTSHPENTSASAKSGMREMGGPLVNQVDGNELQIIELIPFNNISASNAGCNILKNCHSDASCMYSEANDEFFCRLVPILTFY